MIFGKLSMHQQRTRRPTQTKK